MNCLSSPTNFVNTNLHPTQHRHRGKEAKIFIYANYIPCFTLLIISFQTFFFFMDCKHFQKYYYTARLTWHLLLHIKLIPSRIFQIHSDAYRHLVRNSNHTNLPKPISGNAVFLFLFCHCTSLTAPVSQNLIKSKTWIFLPDRFIYTSNVNISVNSLNYIIKAECCALDSLGWTIPEPRPILLIDTCISGNKYIHDNLLRV